MFRFTIRDVLWLTVVVALVVGWSMEHAQLTAMNLAWQQQQAEFRMAGLRAREMRGGAIITPSPDTGVRALERRGFVRPDAQDE